MRKFRRRGCFHLLSQWWHKATKTDAIVSGMTNAEALALTIKRCDAHFERELENAEIILRDLGATDAEIIAAVGSDGYARKMFAATRKEQIAVATRFFMHGDEKVH